MYEPPHWTKPPVAPIARKGEEQSGKPAAKPEQPSIADLVTSIATIKDGMRALAEQVAGLTARVDDMARFANLTQDPNWPFLTKTTRDAWLSLVARPPCRAQAVNLEAVADEIRAVMPKGWAVRADSFSDVIECRKSNRLFAITREEILDNVHLLRAAECAKRMDAEFTRAVERSLPNGVKTMVLTPEDRAEAHAKFPHLQPGQAEIQFARERVKSQEQAQAKRERMSYGSPPTHQAMLLASMVTPGTLWTDAGGQVWKSTSDGCWEAAT